MSDGGAHFLVPFPHAVGGAGSGSGKSCCLTMIVAGTGAIIRSAALPAKRSISAVGNRSSSSGGMKAARVLLQKGLVVKTSRHQVRQRAMVRRSTLTD